MTRTTIAVLLLVVAVRAAAGPCQDDCARTKIECLNARLAACGSDFGCKAMVGDYDHRVCNPPFESCIQACRSSAPGGGGPSGGHGLQGSPAPGAPFGMPGSESSGEGDEGLRAGEEQDRLEDASQQDRARREAQWRDEENGRFLRKQLEDGSEYLRTMRKLCRDAIGDQPVCEYRGEDLEIHDLEFPGPGADPETRKNAPIILERRKMPGENCPMPTGPYGQWRWAGRCGDVEVSLVLELGEALVPALGDDRVRGRAHNFAATRRGIQFRLSFVSSAGERSAGPIVGATLGPNVTYEVPQWTWTPCTNADLSRECPQRIVSIVVSELRMVSWDDPPPEPLMYVEPVYKACPGEFVLTR